MRRPATDKTTALLHGAALLLVLFSSALFAQDDAIRDFSFDGFEVTAICDVAGVFPPSLFQGGDDAQIRRFAPDGTIATSCNVFLIRKDGKNILVDAGNSPPKGTLARKLESLAISPDRIDAVLLTHVHRDHIGGLVTAAGDAFFSRATLYVSKPELAGRQRDELLDRVLKAYEGRVKTFVYDEEILPGITARNATGHTPGHTCFELGQVRFVGDIVHGGALQFPCPEFCAAFDRDKPAAVKTRRAWFDRAVARGLVLCAAHLPFPGIGYVEREGSGFRFVPCNAVSPKWKKQIAEDAKRDRYLVVYDGKKPDQWLVCDTVVRRIPDGRLACFMLAGGLKEPSTDNYIGLTCSGDEGETWSPLRSVDIGLPREGMTKGQCPTEFLNIENGKKILLFFATHSKTWGVDWKSWSITSGDNGASWDKPRPLPGRLADNTFIRPAIHTRKGWILVPFQHYLNGPKVADSRNGVLISRDDGATWSEHGDIKCPLAPETHLWAEPSIVELPNDHIVMFIRPQWGGGTSLFRADSMDGGLTWSGTAVETTIPNPSSKVALFSLGGDCVALVHNPNPRRRSPLALWISFDGMKTWPYQRVIVKESCDGPRGNLNYPEGFVTPDNKWIYLVFDNNRHQAIFMKIGLPPIESGDARPTP